MLLKPAGIQADIFCLQSHHAKAISLEQERASAVQADLKARLLGLETQLQEEQSSSQNFVEAQAKLIASREAADEALAEAQVLSHS